MLVLGCQLAVADWLLLAVGTARAATYYVTVAGLGGEPDYEQRFTANAMDLDKIFKSAAGAHVWTLTGKQSTKAKLTEVMGEVARDAKPEDDLVVTLIGHGSFDGVEYKFNLVGPDVSAAELAGAVRQGSGEAAVDCGYDERERRGSSGAGAAGARGDCGDEERHGEECDGVRAVLGGGVAGSDGGYGQERLDLRDGGVCICGPEDGGVLYVAEAAGDGASGV